MLVSALIIRKYVLYIFFLFENISLGSNPLFNLQPTLLTKNLGLQSPKNASYKLIRFCKYQTLYKTNLY